MNPAADTRNIAMLLNQIGILFNFLAGFLLAPDIFGEKKLIEWENSIKNRLRRSENLLRELAQYS